MKKIVLLLLGLLFLSGPVLAYQMNIDAPDSLAVGKPLVVTGTTTFGVGTPIDVVLYYQLTTTTEVQRKIVYVLSDKTFRAVFDTTNLKTGTYKVEVPATANGDSVTMHVVNIYDRSQDITLETPLTQSFTGKIYLSGEIKGLENSGIQVEVIDTNGVVIYGPQYIHTDNAAHFASEVPVREPGVYEVSFTDSNGYVGSRTITSLASGLSAVSEAATPTATINPIIASAHARASRNSPAYFIVKTGTGPVTLYTSKSLDWVIEYIDENGSLHMENDQGDQVPERVELTGKGKTLYFKVYPYKYSVTSDVFLYGENVDSIGVSPTVPAPFSSSEDTAPSTTHGAPVLSLLGIISTGIALVLFRNNRS